MLANLLKSGKKEISNRKFASLGDFQNVINLPGQLLIAVINNIVFWHH